MSYQTFRYLVYCVLQSLSWAAISEPAPELHMHVFEQAAVDPMPEPESSVALSTDNKRFQMVVFQPTAAPSQAQQLQQAPAEQGLSQYPRHGIRRKAANDFSVLMATDIGYQQERMTWSVVAAPGLADPLVTSQWDNIDMMRIKGRLDLASPSGAVIRTEADYAWTLSGNGQQKSFGESSGSNLANDGYSWNASAGLGYRFRFKYPETVGYSLTPLAGYAFHRQRFTLQGAEQNTYDADWAGPWLGMDATLNWLDDHELFASAQQHWARYRGTGNWRQLADVSHPDSFQHKANATGMYGAVGYRYRSPRAWGLSLSMDYQQWQADSGQEQFYLSSGSVIESPLNNISREALGVNLGMNWKF